MLVDGVCMCALRVCVLCVGCKDEVWVPETQQHKKRRYNRQQIFISLRLTSGTESFMSPELLFGMAYDEKSVLPPPPPGTLSTSM
jgi:hypothetical protein